MIPLPTDVFSVRSKQPAGLKPMWLTCRGVSLLESLTVVLVITALVTTVGSSVLQTLKTYAGTYTSETTQMELQRAALEMDYFVSTSVTAYVQDTGRFGSTLSSSLQQGDSLACNQPDGSQILFTYSPVTTAGGVSTGKLSMSKFLLGSNTPQFTYTYSTNISFATASGVPRPFWSAPDGGVNYSFTAVTGDGIIHAKGHAATQ
jgi:hypothetical protein